MLLTTIDVAATGQDVRSSDTVSCIDQTIVAIPKHRSPQYLQKLGRTTCDYALIF